MVNGLLCPRCRAGKMGLIDGVLRCSACDRRYPFIGTIACLMPDPALWRALWMARLTAFLTSSAASLANWRSEEEIAAPLPRTRARIARIIAASEEQRTQVQGLFADLQGGESQLLPTPPELPGTPGQPGSPRSEDQAVLTFWENLFRDWVWGAEENAATRSILARLVDAPLGELAVYGVGAGRLAVDLHQLLAPQRTWAIDMNPLPLLVAERLVRGQTVTLPEFPVAPHGEEEVVISRQLRCPFQVRDGFAFLFADALQPPFSPGSLDSVVTSWFIDATGRDVRDTAAAINRALRPGGTWFNLGPLRFKQSLSVSYTIEEIWDLVELSGFELVRRGRDDVPYFDSPVSGSRRVETVFSFSARKVAESKPLMGDAPGRTPPWILDDTLSVPLTPPLIALGRESMFAGSVISLIDGSRSLSEVASEMGRLWGFDAPRIKDQLRAFFADLPLG